MHELVLSATASSGVGVKSCFRRTCDGELDDGSDLSLLIVGGQAGVVACVGPCDFGEVQCALLLLHRHWDITAICTHTQHQNLFFQHQLFPISRTHNFLNKW